MIARLAPLYQRRSSRITTPNKTGSSFAGEPVSFFCHYQRPRGGSDLWRDRGAATAMGSCAEFFCCDFWGVNC
jgi:hypothetical protein